MKNAAFRAGFNSDEQMRKAFRRRFSLSPREYRDRFSSTRVKVRKQDGEEISTDIAPSG
nr:hypothetical protein [uncultured Cohaesibacter sp.]